MRTSRIGSLIIIVVVLVILNISYISQLKETNDINGEKNIDSKPKEKQQEFNILIDPITPKVSWYNNSENPICIDEAQSNNWSWARATKNWCQKGDGSYGDPYIIENVTINAYGVGSAYHKKLK